MCGIVGILSKYYEKNMEYVLKSLEILQNRGYDSNGISYYNNEEFKILKYITDKNNDAYENIKKNISKSALTNNIIGHNRWATHGGVNTKNCHPHSSNDKKWILVHNGIFENYKMWKDKLIENGYHFHTETDSEVIVNMIQYFQETYENTEDVIRQVVLNLEGTFACILQSVDDPKKMWCFRHGSPLLIAHDKNFVMIVSEKSGFLNLFDKYLVLDSEDICTISLDDDDNNISIKTTHYYEYNQIDKMNIKDSPHPHLHWTLSEIYEQPETILKSINYGGRIKDGVHLGGLETYRNKLKTASNLIVLGCGTSYHAGLFGKYKLKMMNNWNSIQVIDGAEFVKEDIPKLGETVAILISQSGETIDLYRCLPILKKQNILTIGIINVVDSLIAREVDCGIYCNAGVEIGVASTKAFLSQSIILQLFGLYCLQLKGATNFDTLSQNLKKLVEDIRGILLLNNKVKEIAMFLKEFNQMFILGKDIDECIAKEVSLKIKEISYIHSEAYASSSLKHGPFALLTEEMPVLLFNSNANHNAKIENCFNEIKSRNAPIIYIGVPCHIQTEHMIFIPDNEDFSSLCMLILGQLLAYHLSVLRGNNPDKPRNLAKVVTVE